MTDIEYQVTLSVDGNHQVTVSGSDKRQVKEALAWSKQVYDKLRERAQRNSPTPTSLPQVGARPQIDQVEQAPTCAIHQLPMTQMHGRKGAFWSCHQKLQDGSWC